MHFISANVISVSPSFSRIFCSSNKDDSLVDKQQHTHGIRRRAMKIKPVTDIAEGMIYFLRILTYCEKRI